MQSNTAMENNINPLKLQIMCKFCENTEKIETIYQTLYLKINGNHLGIYYDSFSCDSAIYEDNIVNIEYCPFCGKKIKE